MAESTFDYIIQILTQCCILPIVLFIITIAISILVARNDKYTKFCKTLLIVGIFILFIGLMVSNIGLVLVVNKMHDTNTELAPGRFWSAHESLRVGDVIEIDFTSDKPIAGIEIKRYYDLPETKTEEEITCDDPYGYSRNRGSENMGLYHRNTTSANFDFHVEKDGDYWVSFKNPQNDTSLNLDVQVYFKHKGNEAVLIEGIGITIVGGVIIIIGLIYHRKHKNNYNIDNFQMEAKRWRW